MDSLLEFFQLAQFSHLGYFGMFASAFLAATILPLSSEIVLTALLYNDFSPIVIVGIATIGNVLGSVVNYALGFWLGDKVAKKWLRVSDTDYVKAQDRWQKYGLLSLCFAWVPVIGDPLTLLAGMLRVNFLWFFILVTTGKLCRYIVIAYFVLKTTG